MGAKKELVDRVLFQCYFEQRQHTLLKEMSRADKKSMAKLVRELVDREIERRGLKK